MPTVDLPAHNVHPTAGSPAVTVIGGPECLATTDPSTGVILSPLTAGFFVGAIDTSGGGQALGFGLWEQPENTVVTDVRFVALAYRAGGGPVPPGEPAFPSGWFTPYPTTYPFLRLVYNGATPIGGWSISNIPVSVFGECDTQSSINHFIGGSDYVIAGIGTPETGTFGLCPEVFADFSYPDPPPDIPVHLAYLAIRITYEFTTPPVMPVARLTQRADGHGPLGGPRRMDITWKSRQTGFRPGAVY